MLRGVAKIALDKPVEWKIPLLGHDEALYPTRQEAEDEITRLVASGLPRTQPQPVREP